MQRALLTAALCCWTLVAAGVEHVKTVTVTTPTALALFPRYDAPGLVVSLNNSPVGTEIMGRLIELPVRIGDRVDQGDVLAKLDCANYQIAERRQAAALAALRAQAQLARRQLDRAKQLLRQRSGSKEQVDQRDTEVSRLKAEVTAQSAALAQAERNRQQCVIRAPFNGAVLERMVGLGQVVAAGTPLVRMLQTHALEVEAEVPIGLLDGLRNSAGVAFVSSGERYGLTIRTLIPQVRTAARSRLVRLSFVARGPVAGTAGRIQWQSSRPHLPPELLVRRGDRIGVFLAEGDTARFHALDHALEGRPTALNLPADSRIVVAGRHSLNDGDALRLSD